MPAPQSACEPFALAQWTGEASLLLLRRQRRPNAGPQDRQGWREARALLDEFQDWRDRLPDSLQDSGLAAKLDEAIERFTDVADTLADIDLPRGFGRD